MGEKQETREEDTQEEGSVNEQVNTVQHPAMQVTAKVTVKRLGWAQL